ncbi:MAG: carboxypeptidase-like regulatory domain-containing protein, partial [Candidatus Saccharimonadales bacterium]
MADGKRGPIPFATVTLLKASDSSLVKGAVADGEGHYSFSVERAGQYRVSASALGMVRTWSTPFDVRIPGQGVAVPLLV